MTCSLLPYTDTRGVCAACGTTLIGAQRRWCSERCAQFYQRNHYWVIARLAALRRDNCRCIRCNFAGDDPYAPVTGDQYILFTRAILLQGREDNWLEVNHITPRLGRGYGAGCHHHLSNLETLCHTCHVKVTRMQRIERVRAIAS